MLSLLLSVGEVSTASLDAGTWPPCDGIMRPSSILV